MADQKLSQLTAATTPLAGTESVYVVQSGNSRKTTVQAIADKAPVTDLTYTAATRTLASSTGADVVLPLVTTTDAGLQSAADKTRIDELGATDSPSFAGLTITGTAAVSIPHIHGALAGPVYIHVKNTGAATLAKGTPVYVVGAVGDTATLEVQAADSSDPAKMPAIGLLDSSLAQNASGHAIVAGELTEQATNGYSVGDPVYVAAGGGTTPTRPTTGIIQQVAIVGRVNATTGSLTATIGPQLDQPHDAVTLAASVADVLDLSGQELRADDPGADRLVFWDDSAGKLTHLTTDSALLIDGTTLRALSTLVVPLTGEAASLTQATLLTVPWWPEARVLTDIPIWMLNTAATGSAAQFDIRVGGTSIFATLPTIDATEASSATAATAAVFSSAFISGGQQIAQGASVAFLCTQIGATVAGAGLKVALPSRRAS